MIRKVRNRVVIIAAISMAVVVPLATRAFSRETKSAIPAGGSNDNKTRTEYISKIHAINEAEMKIAETALSKSPAKNIADYATMLRTEHQDADAKLRQVATQKKLSLTSDEARGLIAELDKVRSDLDRASRDEFPAKFAAAMVDGHRSAIELVTNARKSESDVDLAAFLDGLLPGLRKHLEMAESLRNSAPVH